MTTPDPIELVFVYATERVSIPLSKQCSNCEGTGDSCPSCNGAGTVLTANGIAIRRLLSLALA